MLHSPLSETTIQDGIFDWLDEVGAIWNGTGTRPTDLPLFVWHMEQEPRFALPLLMGRISGTGKVGWDFFGQPVDEVISSVNMYPRQRSGTREFTLYLEAFGKQAFDVLAKVQDACDDISSMVDLYSAGITVVDCGTVVDAHAFLGTMPEERATLEINMRTTSESILGSIGIIEKVELNGIINNGYEDIDIPTITIDTITV